MKLVRWSLDETQTAKLQQAKHQADARKRKTREAKQRAAIFQKAIRTAQRHVYDGREPQASPSSSNRSPALVALATSFPPPADRDQFPQLVNSPNPSLGNHKRASVLPKQHSDKESQPSDSTLSDLGQQKISHEIIWFPTDQQNTEEDGHGTYSSESVVLGLNLPNHSILPPLMPSEVWRRLATSIAQIVADGRLGLRVRLQGSIVEGMVVEVWRRGCEIECYFSNCPNNVRRSLKRHQSQLKSILRERGLHLSTINISPESTAGA